MEKGGMRWAWAVAWAAALPSLAGAADGRTWFGAGYYDAAGYKWSEARLWEGSVVAGDGGVATFGGPCFKGFDQDVEGLVLRGLDFASCGAAAYGGWGAYLVGRPITMTNEAFIASDDVRPQATDPVNNSGRQPQKVSLTLRGTGGNTLVKRGEGTIAFALPVENFSAFTVADGLVLASASAEGGAVLTGADAVLALAGGAVEVRGEGAAALGGDLHAGPGAGLLGLSDGVALTARALTCAADGAAVVSNGTGAAAGKLLFTTSPADAKGRVDPRLVMRDGAAWGAPFRFAKYDAQAGLQPVRPDDARVKPLAAAGADDIALATAEASGGVCAVAEDRRVKALLVDNRANLSIAEGVTLTVGDGQTPGGVIFSERETADADTRFEGAGTLAFGEAPGVIWKGTPPDGKGRGVDIRTRITGTKGVTFASRTTGGAGAYALFLLGADVAGWTGPTFCYGARLWPKAAGGLPPGGDVFVRGGRSVGSAQLWVDGDAAFDQHFRFSGYGPQGHRGVGSDGLGALCVVGKATGVFNGATTLEDEALFRADAAAKIVLNGGVAGPGRLVLTGGGAVELNAANAFTGGLRIGNHAGKAGGAPTVTVVGAAALGTGAVAVESTGQLAFAPGLAQETVTNALSSVSSRPVAFERSALDLVGPVAFAKTRLDADTTTNACSSIGIGACVDLGEIDWPNSAARGELRATTAASTLKAGGAVDFTLNAFMRDGAGRLGFTKTGANTVTLVGAKEYTGPTEIEGGTLRLEGDILGSPSIAYWLDASRPETIDVDAEGRVTAWRSVVGDYAFAAGTYTGKDGAAVYPTPTYTQEAKVNGRAAVTFNNLTADAHEALAGTKAATQRSVFIAARVNGCCHRFGGLFGSMNADIGLRIGGDVSETGGAWEHTVSEYKYNTDGVLYKDGVPGRNRTAFRFGDVQVLTQFHAYDMTGKWFTSPATFRPSLGLYSFYSGGDGSYYRAVAADVCEVIAFDRVLTAAERERVENYLSEKWRGAPCHAAPQAVPPTLAAGTALRLRAGATLDLHGADVTVASLAGEGALTNSSARPATLRVTGRADFNGTVGGAVTLVAGGGAQLKLAVQDEARLRLEGAAARVAAYAEAIPTDALAYWLDAGRPETVRTNAAGEVTNWLSRASSSVAGFEHTAATRLGSSAAPRAYEPAGLNGKPAVHFTDPTQIMKSTAPVRLRTFFLVAKLDGVQNDMGAPWGIWNQDVQYRFAGKTANGVITSLALITPAVPGDTLHINGVDIPLVKMTTTHALGDDVFLLSFRLGDAHRDLDSARLFNFHGLNRNFQDRGARQWVGEVICYERALTDAEYAAVEGYLARKWKASGTGPLPEAPALFADGAGLELAAGGTFAGDVRLNGPFVVDAAHRTTLDPVVVAGSLTLGARATAHVRNYLNLEGGRRHPALVVQGEATGDFAEVRGLVGGWRFVRAGGTWSVLHAVGTLLRFR